jgi:proteasome accessory factor A
VTVRRIIGTEVEYGVAAPSRPAANPMLLSSQIVNAYAGRMASVGPRPKWDFEEESPLRDARGFDLSSTRAPDEVGDDVGLANVILTNGARLYVDHAHPEYSAPETTNPRDAALWDKAGELVMAEAARRVAAALDQPPINLYKNNTDNKSVSYGSHENYLMARSTPFNAIVRNLVPFFVTRQVICGQGRVGIGQDGSGTGFQLSQRADFFEVEVGLETTLKRPIINTRDEPHADPDRYRRLHVIIGDANLSETATLLKLGITSLVLSMIEDNFLAGQFAVDSPVEELRSVSHDPTLKHEIAMSDGRRLTAVQLQNEYCEQARKYVEDKYGADVDADTQDILARWEDVLTRLADDPMRCADELDWVAKLRLVEAYRARDGLDWSSPRLQLVDLQYSDVRREKGLYHRLVARGSMRRLFTDEQVAAAVDSPPEDTRAYFRGECLRRYPDEVSAASWDSVVFDVGEESLVRVPMLEPLRGTKAHVQALLDRCPDAPSLVAALSKRR